MLYSPHHLFFMNTNASTSRYILTTLCIIIVITAFILVGLNAFHLERRLGANTLLGSGQTQLDAKYVEGYLAARKTYQGMCPLINQPTRVLSGTVQVVHIPDSLTILQDSLDSDPLVDHVAAQRWITTTPATVVLRSINKPAEQVQKEFAEFNAGHSSATMPPSPLKQETIQLTDIPAGARVLVESDQDVRSLESIPALRITVLQP